MTITLNELLNEGRPIYLNDWTYTAQTASTQRINQEPQTITHDYIVRAMNTLYEFQPIHIRWGTLSDYTTDVLTQPLTGDNSMEKSWESIYPAPLPEGRVMFINHEAFYSLVHPYTAARDAYEAPKLTDWLPYATQADEFSDQKERAERYMYEQKLIRQSFKAKMKSNLKDQRPAWRYAEYFKQIEDLGFSYPDDFNDKKCKELKRDLLKRHVKFGKEYAKILSALTNDDAPDHDDYDWSDLIDHVETLPSAYQTRTYSWYQRRAFNSIYTINTVKIFGILWESNQSELEDEDYVTCGECGAVHHIDNGHYSENHGIQVCESCCQDGYVYSECMDDWLREDVARQYYPDQEAIEYGNSDYCTSRWASRNDAWWSDRHEAYITDEVDAYYEEDDDYDDDEDSFRRDGLRDYHGSRRDFKVHNEQPNQPFKAAPPLGLELEVYARGDRRDVVMALRDNFSSVGQLILERDGSLDEDQGFEIISDPLGYAEWKDMGPRLCSFLTERDTIAYTAEGNYGIHLTLERKFLTPLQEARMFMFMTAEENSGFIKAIAQRANIYHGDIDMGSLSKEHVKLSNLGGLRTTESRYDANADRWVSKEKRLYGRGKYAPINFKDDLLEVRIFRATLHPESFMKNIEFMYALVEWLKDSTGSTYHHMDFAKWLGKRPRACKDYPHLLNYLRRPVFGIRHQAEKIPNKWVNLLPVTREELQELDMEDA